MRTEDIEKLRSTRNSVQPRWFVTRDRSDTLPYSLMRRTRRIRTRRAKPHTTTHPQTLCRRGLAQSWSSLFHASGRRSSPRRGQVHPADLHSTSLFDGVTILPSCISLYVSALLTRRESWIGAVLLIVGIQTLPRCRPCLFCAAASCGRGWRVLCVPPAHHLRNITALKPRRRLFPLLDAVAPDGSRRHARDGGFGPFDMPTRNPQPEIFLVPRRRGAAPRLGCAPRAG